MKQTDGIRQKLVAYKRKYYTDKLVRGSLIFLSYLLIIIFIISLIEYQFWLGLIH